MRLVFYVLLLRLNSQIEMGNDCRLWCLSCATLVCSAFSLPLTNGELSRRLATTTATTEGGQSRGKVTRSFHERFFSHSERKLGFSSGNREETDRCGRGASERVLSAQAHDALMREGAREIHFLQYRSTCLYALYLSLSLCGAQ